eukprot:TRINITY_DN60922_c0_g1_i1.p1 TRINITY_DN60922_c0_g1~~TRINITY_DN60922_c0_g1_i1.p1  ORF type:complete len:178 (+),score=51.44 TRINITY_DN60922_c0_g1_i1:75-608(+)
MAHAPVPQRVLAVAEDDNESKQSTAGSDEEEQNRTVTPKKLIMVAAAIGMVVVVMSLLLNSGPGAARLTAKKGEKCLDYKQGFNYKYVDCDYKHSKVDEAVSTLQGAGTDVGGEQIMDDSRNMESQQVEKEVQIDEAEDQVKRAELKVKEAEKELEVAKEKAKKVREEFSRRLRGAR